MTLQAVREKFAVMPGSYFTGDEMACVLQAIDDAGAAQPEAGRPHQHLPTIEEVSGSVDFGDASIADLLDPQDAEILRLRAEVQRLTVENRQLQDKLMPLHPTGY